MRISNIGLVAAPAPAGHGVLRKLLDPLPRPARFLGVGGLGLMTDLAIFTVIIAQAPHPLLARLVSLTVATFLTWRLNRALTFERSGRHPADEALRYAIVAGCAQTISYAVFAALVVTAMSAAPQLAVLSGAAAGALVSYAGQLLFAFRPRRPAVKAPVINTPAMDAPISDTSMSIGNVTTGDTAAGDTAVGGSAVDTDVFVIGAGPAGLTAGYCLTKEGRSVTIIERDPLYVGGISRTVDYKGFLFDIGGHRFFSKSKEVVALWREILPDDFIARPRLSRIYYNGKFFAYPLKAFEALFKLGLFTSAACLLSYAFAKMHPVKPARSFHDWVRNQFGEKLFQIFFKTYTEKVWGMSCDEISADWAAQRIKGLDLTTAVVDGLKRSLGIGRKKKSAENDETVKTLIESFQYPRKGPGMMWDAAARKIRAQGGRLLMGRELVALEFDEAHNLWRIEVATARGGRESYTARHVVSSAPLRELAQRLKPAPISLLHARALRYRDFLTVALMLRKDELFPDNWIYIHDPSVQVGRVQNFRSWSPEMVPPGMSCLGLEYFCFEGDGLWNAPDGELIALAKKEVAQIGLADEADVVDACVVRQAKAYPVYDDDYRDNVAAIRLDLEGSYPSLHVVGRNGMHKYNNQDHAMMTAMLTARNILAGARVYDVWNVNEDAEYHEAGEAGVSAALDSLRLVPAKTRARAA